VLGKDLAGFPNGRRLNDDVVDIELQALEGAARTGPSLCARPPGYEQVVPSSGTFPSRK
ncbi:DUF4331 family protein, partial [Streptomyces anulatus]|uniref:DUF4331 family protein n=1 Tax=Streptomyces anulatus TaxID=1892 RepID=UPI003F4CD8B4